MLIIARFFMSDVSVSLFIYRSLSDNSLKRRNLKICLSPSLTTRRRTRREGQQAQGGAGDVFLFLAVLGTGCALVLELATMHPSQRRSESGKEEHTDDQPLGGEGRR